MYSDFASLVDRLQFLNISLNSEVVEPVTAMDQINAVILREPPTGRCFWTFGVWDMFII